MSDDQNTQEIPPAPVPETVPQDSTEGVVLKTPPSLLPENSETPQSDPEPLKDEGADQESEDGSETVQDPQEDAEEDNGPVVSTTPTGQTVTFADGRVVHTRSSDAPVSNGEWQSYERTHQGDQLRYQY